jgi:hypothetical protein
MVYNLNPFGLRLLIINIIITFLTSFVVIGRLFHLFGKESCGLCKLQGWGLSVGNGRKVRF